uniref:Protein kinase domain-containing protein n=1 Tax=Caenorhabditis japonica TaxID=281687 RepID=A0A8R1DT54_CAEJA
MEEIQALKKDKVVAKRWKVDEKLGEGGMGAVFKVRDLSRFKTYAAMKVEADVSDGGVIKLETAVLKSLANFEFVPRLMDSGDRDKYCFMVMTLLGQDLMAHKRAANLPRLCEQTTLRLAMATLFAIKQIHEAGWIHRDIKPGNMVTGLHGNDRKTVYLIDYGMVRSFIAKREGTGVIAMRKARDGEQLFRGTPRYCSLNVHNRKEQGRVDDLWSWLYMLIELHQGLPWRRLTDEKEIADAKVNTCSEVLLKGCPREFANLHAYLEKMQFRDRPDYFGLWSECYTGFRRVRGSFFAPFEWEVVEADKKKEEEEKKKKSAGSSYVPKTEREMLSALSISANRKPDDFTKPKRKFIMGLFIEMSKMLGRLETLAQFCDAQMYYPAAVMMQQPMQMQANQHNQQSVMGERADQGFPQSNYFDFRSMPLYQGQQQQQHQQQQHQHGGPMSRQNSLPQQFGGQGVNPSAQQAPPPAQQQQGGPPREQQQPPQNAQ